MLRAILRRLGALPWELTAGLLLIIVLLVATGLRHCPQQIEPVSLIALPSAIQGGRNVIPRTAIPSGRRPVGPPTTLPFRPGSAVRHQATPSTRVSSLDDPAPASPEATPSDSPPPINEPDYNGWLAQIPADHSPFGICLGTFPGTVALDVQLLTGQPLQPFSDVEGSIDVMANLQQVGLQGTLGSRWFVGVGGYRTFTDQVGWCASLGLRF